MKIRSFDLGEWWRSLRTWMCLCGHPRSAHTKARDRCTRCRCEHARKMGQHGALLFGYRLGLVAGRATSRVSTVVIEAPGPDDPPTVALEVQAPGDRADWHRYEFDWDPADGVTVRERELPPVRDEDTDAYQAMAAVVEQHNQKAHAELLTELDRLREVERLARQALDSWTVEDLEPACRAVGLPWPPPDGAS